MLEPQMANSLRPIFALLLAAATPAKMATFDITTYTIPEGFEVLAGSTNHANFRRVDPGNWVLFGVYGSKASSGDLAKEFAADWSDLSGAPTVAAPAPRKRNVGAGLAAVEGGADCPGIGYVHLVDIDAGAKVVSIIVLSGSAEGLLKTYRKTIDAFLSSVAVKGATRGAPVAGATPPVSAANTEASKFAGSWGSGRTVGAMTITSALDIRADGSYHWVTESGGVVGGRAFANTSRDERGTMSLSGRNAIFRAAGGTEKTYRLNVIAGNPATTFSLENEMFTRR
jgi:hypothetical protein